MSPGAPIRFGTGGWRGPDDEVTPARLVAALRGAAAWLAPRAEGRPILVAYDGRRRSREMARTATQVLSEAGLAGEIASDVTPTPALTAGVVRRRAGGGLMLTASHNPPATTG